MAETKRRFSRFCRCTENVENNIARTPYSPHKSQLFSICQKFSSAVVSAGHPKGAFCKEKIIGTDLVYRINTMIPQ